MNTNEIKKVIKMVEQYMSDTNRNDTAVEGNGYCLTVHWRDGGQTRFSTIEAVEEWLADQRRRDSIPTDPTYITRVIEDEYHILHAVDGLPVTRAPDEWPIVWLVNSVASARYEHPTGIILDADEYEKIQKFAPIDDTL